MPEFSVIVVGAGPVGLLTTLRLARAGISVTCLEASTEPARAPRAMVYHPAVTAEFARAGLLDDVRRRGATAGQICWRRPRSATPPLVCLEIEAANADHAESLVLGQDDLAELVLEHLASLPNAVVRFGQIVCEVESTGDAGLGARVGVSLPDGARQVYCATYVVAADGGRSIVRKLLEIPFEGFTYQDQLVSTNVRFPFDAYGWTDANFCIDPEHWGLVARIKGDLWRVSYGELSGLSHDELLQRVPEKFAAIFPGDGIPEYELVAFSPYRLNQRCAATFRKGNVLLVGDAAHLCNPFGALGLSTGIMDAAAVADALIAVRDGKASDGILDRYAEARRTLFVSQVDPISQQNKERLQDPEPDSIAARDPFLRRLQKGALYKDRKQGERVRGFIATDMSLYYEEGDGQRAETIDKT